jgi:hypothetical protein
MIILQSAQQGGYHLNLKGKVSIASSQNDVHT